MLSVYETIETFGLTEKDADLPIPNDDELREHIIGKTFDTILLGMRNTGLHREIEPIGHGLASLIHRRLVAAETTLDKNKDALNALLRAEDGSEVNTTQIEDTQRECEKGRDLVDGLATMAEAAAQHYEALTGAAFIPYKGSRKAKNSHLTGAVFEAKQWLETHEREQAEQFKVEGAPLAVAGDRDWLDVNAIWERLDKIRSRFRESYNTDLIL